MFSFFKKALGKTNEAIREVSEEKKTKLTKDEFETILLEADVNYDLIERILAPHSNSINKMQAFNSLVSIFRYKADLKLSDDKPYVEMIIGVNGAGKTTTIAKLASHYKKEGKSVILGAADTFRAAAIEQLTRWANKLDIPIIASKQGHDPSIANKALATAPNRKILVLDGTQGSSSINQAKSFHEMIGVDGIIITKLDGTAKGGSVFSIADELKLPIFYIGVGEGSDDLVEFRA
ncbi:MAG: signal recognition particle-docking protein FtsY [Sulfurovaceae bacterium]